MHLVPALYAIRNTTRRLFHVPALTRTNKKRKYWADSIGFDELLEPVSNIGGLRKLPIPVAMLELVRRKYSRITCTKSPPLCKTTFIASLDKSYCLRT